MNKGKVYLAIYLFLLMSTHVNAAQVTKKVIVSRQDEIKLLEKYIKNHNEKIDLLRSQCTLERYDQIVESIENSYTFRSIFSSGETVDEMKQYLEKKFYFGVHQDLDKDGLLKAYESIMHTFLYMLKREKCDDRVIFKPSQEAAVSEKMLPKWIENYRTYSKKTLLKIVANFDKRLKSDFRDLEKKEELYNKHKRLSLIVTSL